MPADACRWMSWCSYLTRQILGQMPFRVTVSRSLSGDLRPLCEMHVRWRETVIAYAARGGRAVGRTPMMQHEQRTVISCDLCTTFGYLLIQSRAIGYHMTSTEAMACGVSRSNHQC